MGSINYFVAGLPESGKTTFLMAFIKQLNNGIGGMLRLDPRDTISGLTPAMYQKLNTYCSFKKLDRTQLTEREEIICPMLDSENQKILLCIPDLSGETFQKIIEGRHIALDLKKKLLDADTVLFFINTETMISEERIKVTESSALAMLQENSGGDEENESDAAVIEKKIKRCTQSDVVDLLQCLTETIKKRPHIKFIISAWDIVEKKYGADILPEKFLEKELPLLFQYAVSNRDFIDCEWWGISAIGGNISDKEERKKLEQSVNPLQYIKVVENNGMKSSDLTKLFI